MTHPFSLRDIITRRSSKKFIVGIASMEFITVSGIDFYCDREATQEIYKLVPMGSAAKCGCPDCLHFISVRAEVHPPEALAIFNALGIDPQKESELYISAGNVYGGWYHFVGEVVNYKQDYFELELSANYGLMFFPQSKLVPNEFNCAPLSQLDFWVKNISPIRDSEESQIEKLVDGWITFANTDFEPSEERRHNSTWAYDKVTDMATVNPEFLWKFILAAYNRDLGDADPFFAAAPLEDLISGHGDKFIDRIENLALRDDRFNFLLGGVWKSSTTDEVWQRIEAVRRTVW
jgi:hypothetical protein